MIHWVRLHCMAADMVSHNHTDSKIGCKRLAVLAKHIKVTIRPGH